MTDDASSEPSGALDGYPFFDDYDGGGTILNMYTSEENVRRIPQAIRQDVCDLIRNGCEVIILSDQIKGVRLYSPTINQ
jgi:hypothetical protein